MTNKLKKYVAISALAVSTVGGGSVLAMNASSMIAGTANAGQPSTGPGGCEPLLGSGAGGCHQF